MCVCVLCVCVLCVCVLLLCVCGGAHVCISVWYDRDVCVVLVVECVVGRMMLFVVTAGVGGVVCVSCANACVARVCSAHVLVCVCVVVCCVSATVWYDQEVVIELVMGGSRSMMMTVLVCVVTTAGVVCVCVWVEVALMDDESLEI